MNVVPIQAPQAQDAGAGCPSCGAEVVAGQRYCLACGQPCSPVRLDFLDVLQDAAAEERARTAILPAPATHAPLGYAQAGYPAPDTPAGALGWLRRCSGLLALVGVLLLAGLIGLLVGHWTRSSNPAGPQVVKIEGGLPLASAGAGTAAPGTSPSAATTAGASKVAPLGKAQEEKEVKEAEAPTVKAPPPAKTGSAGLKKLAKSTGKAHQKEIESITAGGKPIETGG